MKDQKMIVVKFKNVITKLFIYVMFLSFTRSICFNNYDNNYDNDGYSRQDNHYYCQCQSPIKKQSFLEPKESVEESICENLERITVPVINFINNICSSGGSFTPEDECVTEMSLCDSVKLNEAKNNGLILNKSPEKKINISDKIKKVEISEDKNVVYAAKLYSSNVDDFLEQVKSGILKPIPTKIVFSRQDGQELMSISKIKTVFDLLQEKKNLEEVIFENIDFQEFFSQVFVNSQGTKCLFFDQNLYQNFIEVLSKSKIKKLHFESCNHLYSNIFENLPKYLKEFVLKNNFYTNNLEDINFNFSECLEYLDIADIKGKVTDKLLNSLPKKIRKLKLGGEMDSETVKSLQNFQVLKFLCLKKCIIKNLEAKYLPKYLLKLCPNNTFKNDEFKNLPKSIKKINFANLDFYSKINPEINGDNLEQLPKKLKKLTFDTSNIINFKNEFIDKFPKVKEVCIKEDYQYYLCKIERNPEKFIELNNRLNTIRKKIPTLKIKEYKNSEIKRVIPESKFVSNSNLRDLESPGSFTDLTSMGSPEDLTSSMSPQSPKNRRKINVNTSSCTPINEMSFISSANEYSQKKHELSSCTSPSSSIESDYRNLKFAK